MMFVACWLAELGIRRNLLDAPHVSLSFGVVRLFARTFDFPPFCDTQESCDALGKGLDARSYMIWADLGWPGAPQQHYLLAVIPLERRPRR
jgi:hypothetical protein